MPRTLPDEDIVDHFLGFGVDDRHAVSGAERDKHVLAVFGESMPSGWISSQCMPSTSN